MPHNRKNVRMIPNVRFLKFVLYFLLQLVFCRKLPE